MTHMQSITESYLYYFQDISQIKPRLPFTAPQYGSGPGHHHPTLIEVQ